MCLSALSVGLCRPRSCPGPGKQVGKAGGRGRGGGELKQGLNRARFLLGSFLPSSPTPEVAAEYTGSKESSRFCGRAGVCYGSASRGELTLALEVKTGANKELFIKASCVPGIYLLLPACLSAQGTPELQAQTGSSPPAAPDPPKLPRGKQRRAQPLGAGFSFFFVNPPELFGNENNFTPAQRGQGEKEILWARWASAQQLCSLSWSSVAPSLMPPRADPVRSLPHGLCKSLSSKTGLALLSPCSFSSVRSQFHRKPIITMPISCMSQSRGSDRFAGRSPTSVPGPGRTHKTAVFLLFCNVEVGQGSSSSRMKHELWHLSQG